MMAKDIMTLQALLDTNQSFYYGSDPYRVSQKFDLKKQDSWAHLHVCSLFVELCIAGHKKAGWSAWPNQKNVDFWNTNFTIQK